jgi:hypothetical protein
MPTAAFEVYQTSSIGMDGCIPYSEEWNIKENVCAYHALCRASCLICFQLAITALRLSRHSPEG